MSFQRHLNRHDAWIAHRAESATKLAEIGLPLAVYDSESTLAKFLTTGRREDLGLDLDEMSETQFWYLFHFASTWFDETASSFTALERRRLRGCPTSVSHLLQGAS